MCRHIGRFPPNGNGCVYALAEFRWLGQSQPSCFGGYVFSDFKHSCIYRYDFFYMRARFLYTSSSRRYFTIHIYTAGTFAYIILTRERRGSKTAPIVPLRNTSSVSISHVTATSWDSKAQSVPNSQIAAALEDDEVAITTTGGSKVVNSDAKNIRST